MLTFLFKKIFMRNIAKIGFIIYFMFFFVLTNSCIDNSDYEFDRLSSKIDWQPEVLVPIGSLDINIDDLINDYDETEKNPDLIYDTDGLLHLIYSEELDFDLDINEILEFPEQEIKDFIIKIPTVRPILPVELTTYINIDIQTSPFDIMLSEIDALGLFEFSINNPLNTTCEITVTLPTTVILSTGKKIEKTFILPANSSSHKVLMPFNNTKIVLKKPYSYTNKLPLEVKIKIYDNLGVISSSGDFVSHFEFKNLDFLLAKFFLREQKISVEGSTIDIGFDMFEYIDGDFEFVEPIINLNINSSLGLPLFVELNFKGQNSEGNEINNLLVFPLSFPRTEEQLVLGEESNIIVDSRLTDVSQLINSLQNGAVSYSYNIIAGGTNSSIIEIQPFLLTKESKLDVRIDFDIPFYLGVNNLIINDTIKDVDISDVEKIIDASLFMSSINAIPLGVKLEKIYLADKNFKIIDSITPINIIKPAAVFPFNSKFEGQSRKTTVSINEEYLDLTTSQINKLDKVKAFILKARLFSESDKPIKLMKQDRLQFTLAIRANLDMKN